MADRRAWEKWAERSAVLFCSAVSDERGDDPPGPVYLGPGGALDLPNVPQRKSYSNPSRLFSEADESLI